MKHTILGFKQDISLEYELDLTDLCILRYFVDFVGSGDMKILIDNNKPFYWVNYDYLKETIPVIKIASNDVLRRRFKKMVDKKILEHKHVKDKGRFAYYGFGENYKFLITTQKSEPTDSKVGTSRLESRKPADSKVGTKINLLNNKSNIYIDIYSEVIDYLNERVGSSYRSTTKTNRNLIKARLNEGFKIEDFKKVIDIKTKEWQGTQFEQYLRPQTLFSNKFEGYLNQGGLNNGNSRENKQDNRSSKNEPDFSKFS